MKNLFFKVIKHELINGSFYIFIGGMFANVLAFLLNLFLARNLSYADYAVYASLLSIITLALIPAGSINTIIVKFATNYFVKNENDNLKSFYLSSTKFILSLSLIIVLLFLVLIIPIKEFLHLDNIWYIVVAGLSIIVSYLTIVNNAFLQSLLKFGFMSFLSSFGGMIKLLFGVMLMMLGFKAFSGLWAVFFMSITIYFLGFIPLIKVIKRKTKIKKIFLNKNEILAYSLPTFITVLFLTSFTSTDVILVKHFFNPRLAGFYAGLSLISKVIFYFTAPIPTVMFPLLIKKHATGKNFTNLFYFSLVLVLFPGIMITIFYFLFPDFVINFFLGGRNYIYIGKYLGIFALYITIFSLINVCVNFFLSFNKTNISYLVVAGALMQILLIYLFHANFYQVIWTSLTISSLLFISLLYIFFRNYGSFQNLKQNM